MKNVGNNVGQVNEWDGWVDVYLHQHYHYTFSLARIHSAAMQSNDYNTTTTLLAQLHIVPKACTVKKAQLSQSQVVVLFYAKKE